MWTSCPSLDSSKVWFDFVLLGDFHLSNVYAYKAETPVYLNMGMLPCCPFILGFLVSRMISSPTSSLLVSIPIL